MSRDPNSLFFRYSIVLISFDYRVNWSLLAKDVRIFQCLHSKASNLGPQRTQKRGHVELIFFNLPYLVMLNAPPEN